MEKTNNLVLKGEFEEAMYKEQELSEYSNNPFIQALPPIFNEDDVLERFMVTPRITQHKQSEANIRYHVLKRVKNFIQPLPIHFEVERRLSTLIRRGYLARNPLDKTFLERIRVLHELREEEELAHKYIKERLNFIRSTADSLSIIGISGIGKTTAIERLLLMYPQVIKHETYEGQPFNRTQIVWLKIDCPYDGSLSTLCKSFFKAIDDLLGTRYLEKYGYLNRVTSTMLLHMTSLASMYGIGVLVIDEIQHLLHSKNDQEEMLNFFVTLSNTVGIPTVLIGTSKAQKLFKGNFRQARRAASDGAIIWDRMGEDSEEWEFFLETLWELECLKTYSELTEEIKKTFYYECQGITAVAVNLFILAQERVLFDEDNPNEIITPRVLKKTAKEDMQTIQPMMNAIRTNNLADMMKYEDIMINLDEVMLNHKRNTEIAGRIQEAFKERQNTIQYKRQDTIENLTVEVAALGIFDRLKDNDIKNLIRKIVDENPLDTDFHQLKTDAIQQAIALNQQKKDKMSESKSKNSNILPLLELRKKALDKKQQQYPNDSRTQIRLRFQREYIYLYRQDKEWLFNHLPINRTKGKPKATVDWEARDREYCSKIKRLYKELIMLDKPVRITISIIGKRLGIVSNLQKHINKLPQTKKLLNEVTETTQQFQIRRCCNIIDQMLQEGEPVSLWKVQRMGAVKSHHFHEIKLHLEAYIDMKQEVDNYERTTS